VSGDVVRGDRLLRTTLVFHAYINEMHSSRSKIPSKKISSDSVAQRDLIPALKE
jgi:hypothetical protein